MRTIDVINLGIDRNFLRTCEEKKLISPQRVDNDWIIDKNYIPREYTQKDIEVVWHAYLCRKMGLSFEQIIALNNGEEICTRASLSKIITKYENQIQELQAIVDFMKYVKGFGFIPTPPTESLGSTDFKNYLIDFINKIDKDKQFKKYFELTEQLANITDFENIPDSSLENIEALADEINAQYDETELEINGKLMLSIKEKSHLDPMCDEAQAIIHSFYDIQKKTNKNSGMTPWDFGYAFAYMLLLLDSDLNVFFKNVLGEEAFNFLLMALLAFLNTENPELFVEHFGDPQSIFKHKPKQNKKEDK